MKNFAETLFLEGGFRGFKGLIPFWVCSLIPVSGFRHEILGVELEACLQLATSLQRLKDCGLEASGSVSPKQTFSLLHYLGNNV